jgi:DNA-binding beta-propeller fold protein YncE
MAGPTRHMRAGIALMSATLALAACTHGGTNAGSGNSATVKIVPERIVPAPKSLMAAAEPQPNGIMWALAGQSSAGLFEVDSSSGHVAGSVSVSEAARSLAESSAGVLGLALGTNRSGALELLDGRTAKVIRTVELPAPARQVVVGSDGTTFYVLTAWTASASVTIVNSGNGQIHGSVPVPADTVSIAPDVQQATLYALQENGLVNEIGVSGGKIATKFKVGGEGKSIALSPDGSTLYVLKGTPEAPNVAVVNVSTESIRRVLPTPSHCLQLLISASGNQLYEVVGAPGYGNIQVFAV